jgi:hypothetical protein
MDRSCRRAENRNGGDGSSTLTVLRTALEESEFGAARGRRPPSRLVQGSQDQVWEVVARMRARVRHEYVSFDDPSYLVRSGAPDRIIARGPATMRPMIERGVRVRQVTTRTGLRVDENHGTILWSRGAAAKAVDRLPFKAGVLDRAVALVPADLSVLANGMLVVTDPLVVRLVLAQHRALWDAGDTVRPEAATTADGPPPHLRAVLPMLASGENDHVAAAAAGMSQRTYSRRVAELITLLGVRTRFQAGLEAARRGWL